jgi:hypothetical protein
MWKRIFPPPFLVLVRQVSSMSTVIYKAQMQTNYKAGVCMFQMHIMHNMNLYRGECVLPCTCLHVSSPKPSSGFQLNFRVVSYI